MDGHVDSARFGRGAFFRLGELRVGEPVEVVTREGSTLRYVVSGRQQFPKSALPAAEVFSQEVGERLVLITCGGEFDGASRHYTDNVVVYADPAQA